MSLCHEIVFISVCGVYLLIRSLFLHLCTTLKLLTFCTYKIIVSWILTYQKTINLQKSKHNRRKIGEHWVSCLLLLDGILLKKKNHHIYKYLVMFSFHFLLATKIHNPWVTKWNFYPPLIRSLSNTLWRQLLADHIASFAGVRLGALSIVQHFRIHWVYLK